MDLFTYFTTMVTSLSFFSLDKMYLLLFKSNTALSTLYLLSHYYPKCQIKKWGLPELNNFSQIMQLINGKDEIKTRVSDSGVCLLCELRETLVRLMHIEIIFHQQEDIGIFINSPLHWMCLFHDYRLYYGLTTATSLLIIKWKSHFDNLLSN